MKPEIYQVLVDDNFHYMDEDERICAGEFETYEAALAKARQIVEESVANHRYDYSEYTGFGDDAFVMPVPPSVERFSAWTYAKKLCEDWAG